MTDPTFDAPRKYRQGLTKLEGPALAPEDLGAVDIALVSHDEHADNLDVAGREFLDTVPTVLSTPGASTRVDGVSGMKPWSQLAFVGKVRVRVTAVPAQHGPRLLRPTFGRVTGFVIEAPGWPTVYFSGDNSSVRVAKHVVQHFPRIDVALVCAGGAWVAPLPKVKLTMDAARVAKVAEAMPHASIVPIHVDDWKHFRESRDEFVDVMEAEGLRDRVLLLERGTPRAIA